ncbi:MAG: RNA polymerase factor sigma-32 [Bdellovibrionales bacterium]|nr:RNA polymerase factor sigma-32 [Bdellovibrionales bacterium]
MKKTKQTSKPEAQSLDEEKMIRQADEVIENYTKLPIAKSSTAITPTDPIAKYMAEIRQYPLLSKEDEEKLTKKYYETGDPQAAEILVKANLRFVVKIASEYAKFGSRLIDLIQEGNVGLMHAIKEFNPYKGVRLITYAVWWIRGYIQEHLMKQYSMVKIGTTQNQRKLFYQLQKEKENIDKLGETEVIKQLSSKLGIDENEVEDMTKRMIKRDLSLDQPIDDDSSSSLIDLQTTDTEGLLEDVIDLKNQLNLLSDKIEEIKKQLNKKELYILEERILAEEPKSLAEIGRERGVSREAVRQMEARVIDKIKQHFLATSP